uniref:Uncharacterized protein n=1 Tax=Zea mays TaxID=4577 RepID=C4J7T1_MAIZE|nr:unknown [Zea mays]
MLVDVLASASLLDVDDDSWSIRTGLSSVKCGSITISPAPSCSNFGLLEPESPPGSETDERPEAMLLSRRIICILLPQTQPSSSDPEP